jgi:hypothetical protein
MKLSIRERNFWLELTRIARMEIILDKMENMLSGLDLDRSDPMFLQWEMLSELNGEALSFWTSAYVDGEEFSDWLSTDGQGKRYRGEGGVEGGPGETKETL